MSDVEFLKARWGSREKMLPATNSRWEDEEEKKE